MFLEAMIEHAARRPGEPAMRDERRQITYKELSMGSSIMAGHLEKLGLAGKRVALMIPQSCAFAVAFLGAWWAGCVPVPLNFLLRPEELLRVVRDSGAETVLTVAHFKPLAEALAAAGVNVVFMEDFSFLKIPGKRPLPPAPADDLAVILYTSGTSGAAKGVMLSHGNIGSNATNSIAHARFNEQMPFLGILPMFHILALVDTLLVPLILGCEVVYQARFQPAAVFEAISRHKIKVMIAVPTMYGVLLESKAAKAGSELGGLQYALSGGERLPPALAEAFEKRFGLAILEGFGLTETCSAVTIVLPWAKKPGSVGKPIPQTELRVVDDQDQTLGVDAEGELLIKSPAVMQGYLNRPEETAAVMTDDGYFRTGDLARVDGEGFLSITGRKKELIIMAGEKISPGEIEDACRQHPAVLAVAAVGIPDAQRGEAPAAFVQLKPDAAEKPTEQDLRSFIRQRIAPYKTPREIYFVDDMPRSPTGKILKRLLKVPATPAVSAES